MLFNLQFILVPLIASLVLLTLTSYFGIHVLKREIIFIDIALAQISVLGGVIAIYLEHTFDIHGLMIGNMHVSGMLAYAFSLVFCIGAALVFTYLKTHYRSNNKTLANLRTETRALHEISHNQLF